MHLQERGDPGHDRQREDREAEGQNAKSEGPSWKPARTYRFGC